MQGNSNSNSSTSFLEGYKGYMPVDAATWDSIQAHSKTHFLTLKTPREFFDKNKFSAPKDFNEFTSRLSTNLKYYQSNYILLALVAVLYSLITNPWLLFDVFFVLVGIRLVSAMPEEGPVSLIGGKISITRSQAWVALSMTAVLLLYFTSATSSIFWIASIIMFAVCFHAGFMQKPIEDDFGGV